MTGKRKLLIAFFGIGILFISFIINMIIKGNFITGNNLTYGIVSIVVAYITGNAISKKFIKNIKDEVYNDEKKENEEDN